MGVRHSVAVAAILLMLLAFCSSASASVACPTDLVQPTDALAFDTVVGVVCDLNVTRAQNGLPPLRWSWYLWGAAQRMAADIRTRHYFEHVTPDGRTLADRVEETGYLPDDPTWALGENLGWGTGPWSSPLSIVLGWMDSPGHRENVLDPQFDDVAVGVAQGSPTPDNPSGMVYVADFGTRGTPPPPPAPPASSPARVPTRAPARLHRAYRRGRGWARVSWSMSARSSVPSWRQVVSSRSRNTSESVPQLGQPRSASATSER